MAKRKKPIQFNEKRLFYNIKEVADHFALNVSALRYWEQEFDNIKPQKTSGGARQFTKEDIQQVEIVYHLLKEKGMTIEGAKQKLKERKDDEEKRVAALHKMKNIKKELLQLQDEFNKLHDIQKYSNTEKE